MFYSVKIFILSFSLFHFFFCYCNVFYQKRNFLFVVQFAVFQGKQKKEKKKVVKSCHCSVIINLLLFFFFLTHLNKFMCCIEFFYNRIKITPLTLFFFFSKTITFFYRWLIIKYKKTEEHWPILEVLSNWSLLHCHLNLKNFCSFNKC